jgi:hypothetical protein
MQVGERLVRHASSDPASVDQLAIVGVVAQQKRAEVGPRSLGVCPADHDKFLPVEASRLPPESPVAWRIRRVGGLGDNAFVAKAARMLANEFTVAGQVAIELILREWKRRSIDPSKYSAAHGFVLFVYSPRLALASPDDRLLAFSVKLRDLWGCLQTEEPSGTMHWETLFIKKPNASEFLKFEFSVDFFSAQGDGRWWQDHRAPGGVLFTANSVGHMQKCREWYEGKEQQADWVLERSMLTIDAAAETSAGKSTWLKTLDGEGQPCIPDVSCPFSAATRSNLRDTLRDKDWTRYGGYLHTDHSIRAEFFDDDPATLRELQSTEYLEDFTYLYDPASNDHKRFVSGTDVSNEVVDQTLGHISTWQKIYKGLPKKRQVRKLFGAFVQLPSFLGHLKSETRLAAELELTMALKTIETWMVEPK